MPYRQWLREQSLEAYEIIKNRTMNGLIIACKQHPKNILLHLWKYLQPSMPFAVFCPYKEPLLETYMAVKDTGKAILVTLSESWLREYQVLPDRSHPEVMMSGGGGYILTGIYVDNTDVERSEADQNHVNGGGSSRKRQRTR